MPLGYVKNTQEGRGAKDAQKCIFLLKMHFCASLACDFLRGHAGSLALDLAYHGATWRTDEGINRARHTFPTFFKSYYRATVKRHIIAFQAVQAAGIQLRFEEAALL